LLSKWLWRLGTRSNGLWKKVIESKYDGWRNLDETMNMNYFSGKKILRKHVRKAM